MPKLQKGKGMKVKIEIDPNLPEEEVVIRCRQMGDDLIKLQSLITDSSLGDRCIALRQGETVYYVSLDKILFFETEGKVIQAHTGNNIFETDYKLYMLEESLPGFFMRTSKSTIINLNHIYSITRNLTASSLVEFADSKKKVYVSRNYYKALIERLNEKRRRI